MMIPAPETYGRLQTLFKHPYINALRGSVSKRAVVLRKIHTDDRLVRITKSYVPRERKYSMASAVFFRMDAKPSCPTA